MKLATAVRSLAGIILGNHSVGIACGESLRLSNLRISRSPRFTSRPVATCRWGGDSQTSRDQPRLVLDLSICSRHVTTKKYYVTSLLNQHTASNNEGMWSGEEPGTVTIASSGQGFHFSTSQHPTIKWNTAAARRRRRPGEGSRGEAAGWGGMTFVSGGVGLRQAVSISQPRTCRPTQTQ